MHPKSPIIKNVRRYVSITEEEEEAFLSILETREISRGQFIEKPNSICSHQTYVIKGALRSYFISDDGIEHTLQFAIEDWFISDFNSYITQTPASLYVEAIEKSVVQQFSYQKTEDLCKKFPVFERYFRLIAQKAFAYSQKRILTRLNNTAEERYLIFTKRYPTIIQKVPQYMLASYLGMSPEFLSKIRNKIVS